ncbi:MAG: hypothetical protein KAV87_47460 [Desulfobacteraceae bacterium]|nr:hypothetical protein [Desulfobacteraceae bacterium]
MISRISDYVRERIQEGAFREMDHRTIIYAYQAMISNLAIYKSVLKEMDFVNIDELSRDCASIFLKGIVMSPDAVPASELKEGRR